MTESTTSNPGPGVPVTVQGTTAAIDFTTKGQ